MEILSELPMPRLLVVVEKSGTSVPDLINSGLEWHPSYRREEEPIVSARWRKMGRKGFSEKTCFMSVNISS